VSEQEREDRADAAWLLARERGQPGPAVSDATAARYARLQSLISDLPETPDGVTAAKAWQQKVFAAIDAVEAELDAPGNVAPLQSLARASDRLPAQSPTQSIDRTTQQRRSARSRRWVAAAAISSAAVSVVLLLVVFRYRGRGPDESMAEPRITSEIEPASTAHRTSDPSVGDKLIVRGVIAGPGELRVYNDAGVEQARCAAPAPDCTVERSGQHTTLRLTVLLRAPGALRAILFGAPLGSRSQGMDADLEAAASAGLSVTPLEPVDVH
jgi:hypothetical protein